MIDTKECIECGAEFSFEYDDENRFTSMSRLLRTRCDPCCDKIEEGNRIREEEQEEERRLFRWNTLCPPIYRETNVSHPDLNSEFRDAALGWIPSSIGLGFMGESGGGKTRLMFLAMRKGFDKGMACSFLTHNQFSKLVIDAFSGDTRAEQRKRLDFLAKVQLLFIDDLGKAPSTERTDAELEELIEIRGSNMLPTLWTANGHGEWLIKRFGPDRGDALVRRLAEFSTVVKA